MSTDSKQLNCPDCGAVLDVPAYWIGTSLICSSCLSQVAIPADGVPSNLAPWLQNLPQQDTPLAAQPPATPARGKRGKTAPLDPHQEAQQRSKRGKSATADPIPAPASEPRPSQPEPPAPRAGRGKATKEEVALAAEATPPTETTPTSKRRGSGSTRARKEEPALETAAPPPMLQAPEADPPSLALPAPDADPPSLALPAPEPQVAAAQALTRAETPPAPPSSAQPPPAFISAWQGPPAISPTLPQHQAATELSAPPQSSTNPPLPDWATSTDPPKPDGTAAPTARPVRETEDWTPLRTPLTIGMTGELYGEPYTVRGRVRYRDGEERWDEWMLVDRRDNDLWLADTPRMGAVLWHPFTAQRELDRRLIETGAVLNLGQILVRVRRMSSATTEYLEGDCTETATVGDHIGYADGVAGREIYNIQWVDKEVAIYHGRRLTRPELEQAFGIGQTAPALQAPPSGLAPGTPGPARLPGPQPVTANLPPPTPAPAGVNMLLIGGLVFVMVFALVAFALIMLR